jgi:predicted N-acyltransferase
MSEICSKIYKSITQIGKADWDSIVGEKQILASHGYAEIMENSGIPKKDCYYPVVYKNGRIVAHACVYYFNVELDIMAGGPLKKVILGGRKLWKNFFILRSLECGCPIALGNTIAVVDSSERREALKELCSCIEKLAHELKARLVLFRDFFDKETEVPELLKKDGYSKIHNLPQARIDIKWKTFDDYLSAMRSSYRSNILKAIGKCSASGVTMEILDSVGAYAYDLKRLYDNVYERAKDVKRERLTLEFFRNIDKYLAGRFSLVLAKKDGNPAGFMLVLLNGKEAITVLIGMDYGYSRGYCIYFNLFYKSVELAINKGMEEIDMGITTLDPKRDMGSYIAALNMYMKHFNPALNRIIPWIFDIITPPDTTEPRDVFK